MAGVACMTVAADCSKQLLKLAAIRSLFRRGHDDLGAAHEGKKELEDRDVKRTWSDRQQRVLRFDAWRFSHGQKEVDQSAPRNHDALWLSRGT